ncbi:peptide ABC transporter substrate-binding protein [Paenibacillus sp. CAA11]|uniref:peptide ABC transporter substrate-binding protein n=1 Tax=Paenibacillus sp. CAA11 TaxID=1532905 RepID=UPI000D3755F3|nr:peptide ABC transporter substrate-binding protein [Paenibacillus sp. CAA11]AWB45378.1 peptide ABC transporter substrate-binding protein [Paenibacillus sp. CAA11]
MKKRWLTLLSLILVVGTILAGCGGSNGASNNENKNKGTGSEKPANSSTTGEEKLAADQTLRINLASEPPTLDPALSKDNISSTVLRTLFEGLTIKDEKGEDAPGVAESWQVLDNGKKYVFKIRQNAKWSNGDPVTAKDFEFAWKRVLDPKMQPAPDYTYQLYYLKNAEAYNTGKATADQVGVKATDDYTLTVELENPTPYWLGLTSFSTYYPVHQASVSNPKWANDASTLVSNGPFKLENWTTGSEVVVVKNDLYWDNKNITLSRITMSINDQAAAEIASYKSGQLDIAGRPIGEMPTDQIPALKQELPDEFQINPVASTYFYEFNNKAEPFDNLKIRKAFTMAINRQELVDKVTLASQKPAFGFVSEGIKGVEKDYREEHPDNVYGKEDIEEAKKLLKEGMAEKGYTKLPPIELLYNTNDNHKKVALAIADMWKKNLGAEVTLRNEEFQVYLQSRKQLNYQVARAGWVADYDDPMTFIDQWTSTSGNNDSGWSNPEYDKLVKDAYATGDNKQRNEYMAKAEDILLKDNQVIMPLYYYTDPRLVKPYVKGLLADYSGALDFTRIKLLEH